MTTPSGSEETATPVARLERRRAPRRDGTTLPAGGQVRVRAGREATVVNLSRLGILLESTTRLLPGQRYTLRWVGTDEAGHTFGRVVRAEVAALDEEDGVLYRAALEFVGAVDIPREAPTRHGNLVHAPLPGIASTSGT